MTGKVHNGGTHRAQLPPPPPPPADAPANASAADELQKQLVANAFNPLVFLFVSQSGDSSLKVKIARIVPLERSPKLMPLVIKFGLDKGNDSPLSPFQLSSLEPDQQSKVTTLIRQKVAAVLANAHISPTYVRLYFDKPPESR